MISVIVPVCNVEKYLRKCLDSIVGQTYRDLQIILIENNSTDSSPVICDEYAVDERVIVVHSKCTCVGDARNEGLDIASGEYIAFVDSDDYLELTMFEKMLQIMQNDDMVDLVETQLGYDNGGEVRTTLLPSPYSVSGDKFLEQWFDDYKPSGVPRTAVWSKLFKKEFWKGKRFPSEKCYEEYFLTVQSFYEARKVYVINEALYVHRGNNLSSITHQRDNILNIFLEKQNKLIMEYCADKGEVLRKLSKLNYYRQTLYMYANCYLGKKKNSCKYLESCIRKNSYDILETEDKWTMNLQFRLFLICPYLYVVVFFLKDYIQKK